MKKRMESLFKNRNFAAGCAAVALTLVIGSAAFFQSGTSVPEFPSYTDPVMETSIEEEETPLASAPKVQTKTSKSTSTKKVALKKAATKTYTKKLPTTKKTTKKTASTSTATVVTQTTVAKASTEKYTKKSKTKVVTTVTITTVTTTTTAKSSTNTNTSTNTNSGSSSANQKYTADIKTLAPLADSRVLNAYQKLGFTVEVDSSVSYAGYFDARSRKIILQRADNTVYHELGHFVAFIAGNADQTSSFKSVYSQEKSKFTGVNKAYATQNSAEYFAESYKDYTLNAASLKSTRPQTYAAMEAAANQFTDATISRVQTIYGPIWK